MAQMKIRGTTQIMPSSISINELDSSLQSLLQAGVEWKASVRVATTGVITLSGTQTIDGVALSVGDRVLVKDQTPASQNGIYVVASGAWTRATDADTSAEVTGGMTCWVNEGTVNGDTQWVLITNDTITLGSTSLTFTQASGLGQVTAGAGLTKSGNTLDVGAGDGIQVNADTVEVKLASSSGLTKSGSGLSILAPVGSSMLKLEADGLKLNVEPNKGLSIFAVGGKGVGILLPSASGLQVDSTGLSILIDNTGANLSISAAGLKMSATPQFSYALFSTHVAISDPSVHLVSEATGAQTYTLPDGTGTILLNTTLNNSFVHEEVPSGAINDSNTTFTITSTPRSGSVKVYLNGLRLRSGAGNDYTVSGTTITMLYAPKTGDTLIAEYLK